jgi:hypothetical protein
MSKKSPSSPPPVSAPSARIKSIPFHINIIFLIASFFLVLLVYKNFPSYTWVKDELIKENLKLIKKYSRLSLDERIEAKVGFDYSIIRIIKDGTPSNAVILMPPIAVCSDIRTRQKASKLNGGGIQNRIWCDYYLFPRKVVYYDSSNASPINAQYLAVLGGWGYKEFGINPSNRSGFEVIKIK